MYLFQDYPSYDDIDKLLSPGNIDLEALKLFAYEAADYTTDRCFDNLVSFADTTELECILRS